MTPLSTLEVSLEHLQPLVIREIDPDTQAGDLVREARRMIHYQDLQTGRLCCEPPNRPRTPAVRYRDLGPIKICHDCDSAWRRAYDAFMNKET